MSPKIFCQNNESLIRDNYRKLIISTINVQEFQEALIAQKFINQPNIVILKNDVVNEGFELNKFSHPVFFLSEKEINEKKLKAFIKFTSIEINEKFGIVKIQYQIQGYECVFKFSLVNNEWVSTSTEIVEN